MVFVDMRIITPEKFSAAIGRCLPIPPPSKMAIAVSGGGDSMALALLARTWAKENNVDLFPMIVDHGLRLESSDEAKVVSDRLKDMGLSPLVLTWQGEKPQTHIQERARAARYRLMMDACRARNIDVLATAHNAEDQVETFWMRLSHGSGLDGLTAMAAARQVDGVTLVRPLLSFSREDLRETCRAKNILWVEDPSNTNDKYLRVRLRGFEDLLRGEGLSPERLQKTIEKLEEARAALDAVAEEALTETAKLHPEGYVTFNRVCFEQHPKEIKRRMLAAMVGAVLPQEYPLGFDGADLLLTAMAEMSFRGRTLAGCDIFPLNETEIALCREAAAVAPPITATKGAVWDDRFVMQETPDESLLLGKLGEEGVKQLRKNVAEDKTALRALGDLPHKVRLSLPALWRGENLVAVPHVSGFLAEKTSLPLFFRGRLMIV